MRHLKVVAGLIARLYQMDFWAQECGPSLDVTLSSPGGYLGVAPSGVRSCAKPVFHQRGGVTQVVKALASSSLAGASFLHRSFLLLGISVDIAPLLGHPLNLGRLGV
jgi:hypothetical protein